MFTKLLQTAAISSLRASVDLSQINELRLRINGVLTYSVGANFYQVKDKYLVTRQDIEKALCTASGNALYAMNDKLINGYINYKYGIRIGVSGEAVTDKDKIIGIKNVASLVIRIPKQIKGCSLAIEINKQKRENVLILSSTYGGKTTFVRDLARRASNMGVNTVVIDERYELSGIYDGNTYLDLGSNTDVIAGMKKSKAYIMAIRSLNPQLIVTDEVFGVEEQSCVEAIMRSGVTVYATMHAANIEKAKKDCETSNFIESFDRVVTLSNQNVGEIIENQSNA